MASEVAGFDETGFRVDGRLHWVHCARTGKYTLLMVHARRGRQAMEAMGILPCFAEVTVHDAWGQYDTYAAPDHQLCCAYALVLNPDGTTTAWNKNRTKILHSHGPPARAG